MAIRDIANDLEVELLMSAVITTDTTTFSPSTDVAHFDAGFVVSPATFVYADGTYVVTLQDSPDDSVWTDVPTAKLIDPGGAGSITISAQTSAGDLLGRLGAFSTNQFIRLKVVSTSTTSGSDIIAVIVKAPEQTPA